MSAVQGGPTMKRPTRPRSVDLPRGRYRGRLFLVLHDSGVNVCRSWLSALVCASGPDCREILVAAPHEGQPIREFLRTGDDAAFPFPLATFHLDVGCVMAQVGCSRPIALEAVRDAIRAKGGVGARYLEDVGLRWPLGIQ